NSEVIMSREGDKALGADVHFESIDDAIRQHPEIVEPYLHAIVPTDRTKFAALHGAFRSGGTFVYVPTGVTVELPLQALTYLDAVGAARFPHTLLVVGDDAEVTFIDRYVSPDLERAFSNAVVEIHAGNASRVRYVSLQDWGSGVTHLSVQRAILGREAQLRSLSVQFGGDLARSEFESVLSEPGAHSEMLGLYFAAGTQHFDHRTLQDHVAPNGTSDLLYKGARKEAERLIVFGFFQEVLDRVQLPEVRQGLADAIERELEREA